MIMRMITGMPDIKACMKKALVLIFVAFYALSPFSVYYWHGEVCPCSDGMNECGLAGYKCPCCDIEQDMSMHHESDGPELTSCPSPVQVYAASMAPFVNEPLQVIDSNLEFAYIAPLKETSYRYYSDHSLEKPPPVSS